MKEFKRRYDALTQFWQGFITGVLKVYLVAVFAGIPVVILWWPVIERIWK